ncbi:MAG: cytochrome c3 family protein [Acidobacteriota bacterium]|nr:cytochrome c3 family protein [Bryobacteraceae bacterium CoA2 C42]MCA2965829.1 cytochrome c3 family protein [Acidobacteriaceae bacterium]
MRLLCLSLLGALLLLAQDQPIPYSHKTHLKMGLKCNECHTMPGKGEAATFPAESKCMTCHTAIKKESKHIQLLAEYAAKKEPVPWVRVYKLPGFVWFSHKVHTAVVDCAQCHGNVAESEVIKKEKPITMNACMACHDEHKAPNECNFCHNPA